MAVLISEHFALTGVLAALMSYYTLGVIWDLTFLLKKHRYMPKFRKILQSLSRHEESWDSEPWIYLGG